MKYVFPLLVIFFLATKANAQFKNDTIQTKKGERIIDHEIGVNIKSVAVGVLGGMPDNFETGIIYRNILPSGNAMRYSLNFTNNANNFFQPSETIFLDNLKKIEMSQNFTQNIYTVGIGWEFRKPTQKKYTFFVGVDGLLVYTNEYKSTLYSERVSTGDSTYFYGSTIKIPEYEFDTIYGGDYATTYGFGLGLKTTVGFLWSLSDRLNLTTALVTQGFYTTNFKEIRNEISGQLTNGTSSTFDLRQSLVGDLTLSYRF